MTSTVHSTGRASPFVLTYIAEILPQSEKSELEFYAIHLHSSLRAMNGVFSRGTDKPRRPGPPGFICPASDSLDNLGGERLFFPCQSGEAPNYGSIETESDSGNAGDADPQGAR